MTSNKFLMHPSTPDSIFGVIELSMAATFPEPFNDSVVEQVMKVIQEGEIHDLTIALDAQINSQLIPA